ncbi:MAG: FeoA family protein [Thermodesulfobacteriota bacterium]
MSPAPSKRKCINCPCLARRRCLADGLQSLSSFRPGEKGIVHQVCGDPDFRLRMMELGFVQGAEVKVVKYAPLYDPIELELKGYHVSLRRDQARDILMNVPEKAA